MSFLNFIKISYFAGEPFKEAMGNTHFSVTKWIKLICERFVRWKICNLILNLLNCMSYVLTYQRALRAHMLTCQRVLRTYVLTCSRANVPCVLTFSRANVSCVSTCSHPVTKNNKDKFSITCLPYIFVIVLSFSCGIKLLYILPFHLPLRSLKRVLWQTLYNKMVEFLFELLEIFFSG